MRGAERRQPTPNRARRRELTQPAEAQYDRITLEVAQVAQAPPAAQQQGHDDEHQPDDAVVGRGQRRREFAP